MANLFAITKDGDRSKTYHVQLDAESQGLLSDLFIQQRSCFYNNDTEKITYDGRYKASGNEVLVIADFDVFDHVGGLEDAIGNPGAHDKFDPNELGEEEKFVGLCWAVSDGESQILSFQVLNESHVMKDVRKGFMYLFKGKVLEPLAKSGLEIGTKLVAVFEGGELMFKSYYMANRLLGLEDQNLAATKQQVEDLLSCDLFDAHDDLETYINDNVDWPLRKVIMRLVMNNVVDLVAQDGLKMFCDDYEVLNVEFTSGNKVKLPEEKADLKILLGILDDRVYASFTDESRVMVSNSSRPLE